MARILPVLLLLASVLPAETVRFETADGVEIVGDFRSAGEDAPTVVCLPMYRHARATYAPLVEPLLKKGINVLTLDLRGHGESAPDLAERVEKRDPELFNAMHQDVEAAFRWLEEEKGCDPTRFALVGASVGCSVAVHVTVRNRHQVRAVVLLTPGAKYLGVDTLDHLKDWPGTRVFTFCSFEEEKTSKPVLDALAPHDGSNHMLLDAKGIHGTRMFGTVPAIEELVANFMESSLLGRVDLRVPRWPAGDAAPGQPGFFGRILRPRRTVGGTEYGLMAWAVGETWSFGAIVDQPFAGKVRFDLGDREVELPFDTAGGGKVEAGGIAAEQASFRGKTWIVFSREKAPEALVLEFVPREGEPVRLPQAGVFAPRAQPVQ